MPDLSHQIVLVTGASSGIGRATALRAARQGAHVVLAARGEGPLKAAAVECEEVGAASATAVPTDVGDDAAVAELVRTTLSRHGRIDVAVSSAGVVSYGRLEDVPADVFDGVIRTNLIGAVNLARHVIPVLRRQEQGTLVLVGSVIGHLAAPTMTPYAVSKWGVRALARHLQLENRDLKDLHVAYVAPGGVDTPIYAQAANYTGREGSPPPPVASPERVARQILDRVGHDHAPEQLLLTNHVMRFGFSALPRVYDLLVGPMLQLVAMDRRQQVDEWSGNVLDSQPNGNSLSGGYGNVLPTVLHNVTSVMRRRLPGSGR